MPLKNNLKKFREQRGYDSGKDFSAIVGIPYSRYMSYERGSWPGEEVLVRIATLLKVSIDDLLGHQVPKEDAFDEAKTFIEANTLHSGLIIKVSVATSGNVIVSLDNDTDPASLLFFKTKAEFVQYVQMLQNTFYDSNIYHEAISSFIAKRLRELRSQKILEKYFSLDGSAWNKDTDDLILSLEKHAAKKTNK